jgi:hypothetical protein
MNNLAEIFTYASVGVRKSAGMVAHRGTTFGALGRSFDSDRTSSTVCSEGWILTFFLTFLENGDALTDLHRVTYWD